MLLYYLDSCLVPYIMDIITYAELLHTQLNWVEKICPQLKVIINCHVCSVHVIMSLRLHSHGCSVKRVKCCLGYQGNKSHRETMHN